MIFSTTKKKFKFHPFTEYQMNKQLDPFAKPSHVMIKSGFGRVKQVLHDGDMWFETVFRNYKTGNRRIFFVSQKTGMRCKDEPPTGASTVVYLKNDARNIRMNKK